MNLHDFIFSDNRWYRLLRHICFWLGWFWFSGVVQLSIFVQGVPDNVIDIIYSQFLRSLNRFPGIFLFCYFVVYFLVPRFARNGKLKQFIVVFLSSVLVLYVVTFIWFRYARVDPAIEHWPDFAFFYFSFYSNINFTGAVSTCCLMLAIKYYKNWFIRQRRSEQLSRENIQAELQLLKAQVHPHFLFNTLNNIYSFVLTKDKRAAGLVDKLAGMVDYMRAEGENSLVHLEKELQLVNDYIGLEKVRYGDRLDLLVEINGSSENKMIAPLLMIPFVENCFKHGASIMRGQQWIKLRINISEEQLDFKLSNSKPTGMSDASNKKARLPDCADNGGNKVVGQGIGLVNVQKRLQLLYPGKHYLKTESANDIYIVHLQVSLQQLAATEQDHKLMPTSQPA
jgi:hypothetical protein